ncbi:hypothetical protein [Sphingopyxis macrogoltabida]|nr:hypothetical protein [Sphingopyxis macrogoltabida]
MMMRSPHFDNPAPPPISAIPARGPAQEGSASCLAALHNQYGDAAALLRRSDEGRGLSRVRYRDAAGALSMLGVEARATEVLLYRAGVIAQLGLSAHLLDVGFDDQWCAKHIRQDIAKALAYANASGLDWERAEMLRLADTLSPYWKWNRIAIWHRGRPDDGGFALEEVTILLLALLDQVRAVTGHRVYRSDRCRAESG